MPGLVPPASPPPPPRPPKGPPPPAVETTPTVFRLRPLFVMIAAFVLVVVGGGVTLLTLASKGAFTQETLATTDSISASAQPSVDPSAVADAAVPGSTTSSGSHVLSQQDGPCNFTDAPHLTGTVSMIVSPDGGASGTIKGKGNGVRPGLACGASTATMNWSQDYTLGFSGRVANGRLEATGTLTTNNGTTIANCTTNGQPFTCPPYPGAGGGFAMTISGSYSHSTGAGSGTISGAGFGLPGAAKPISGTWKVS